MSKATQAQPEQDNSSTKNGLSYRSSAELMSSLSIYTIPFINRIDKKGINKLFSGKLHSFKEEIKMNIEILNRKKGANTVVANYLDGLETGYKICERTNSENSLQWLTEFNISVEKNELVRKQKSTLSEAFAIIADAKLVNVTSFAISTPDIEIKEESTLTLTERIIIFKCLQKNDFFEKENQENKQKDLIHFLALILGKNEQSIKKAYQQSESYLTSTKLTAQQTTAAIQSLKNARSVLTFSKNKLLISTLDKRIKELELLM